MNSKIKIGTFQTGLLIGCIILLVDVIDDVIMVVLDDINITLEQPLIIKLVVLMGFLYVITRWVEKSKK